MSTPIAGEKAQPRIPKVGPNCGQPKDHNSQVCQAPWQYIVQHSDNEDSRTVCCGKHLTTAVERLMDNGDDTWSYVKVRQKLVDFS